jgi:uroporphyrinogen decarboxylase
MTPIQRTIMNKDTNQKAIWLMRQAGRYLPEFRKIRKNNKNFIDLCLNQNLSTEITLQPLSRFNLDAAIIFSDILMIPYGLGQKVQFKKNFGPKLGVFDLDSLSEISKKDFSEKLNPVYKSIKKVKKDRLLKEKDLIGFVGAPWTLLVYMINKHSPKNELIINFFKDKKLIKETLKIIGKFLKVHIKNQVKSGVTIIQIFDSWAGLLKDKDLPNYVFEPTLDLVNYTKSLNVPAICFPRGIKNYKKFCEVVKPDVVNIDYDVDPKLISKELQIPIQGGLNPKILLLDKIQIKKEATKYTNIFKDHPYIFNLGHGVLPETKPEMIEYLIKIIKEQ